MFGSDWESYPVKTGGSLDWSQAELEATVAAYLTMLALERAGKPYSKAEFRRQLLAGPLASRTDGAIEYRMQNISYVMTGLGQPRVDGYLPAANVGAENEERLRRIILALLAATNTEGRTTSLQNVVTGPDTLMGVKPVFGPIS